ncbi:hypothetical protein N7379_21880 [Rhizobium pusense]|jgi:hypothetical protein|uniref:hypothetical protein n=1 Tax=Agrobacterium pusense TaxID=648995 RepID=UPI0010AEE2FC|nr:hypothetical protein [Agrobacterium pusense]MDH0117138.1 hypothetical protein [Agrobacterium pusense]
MIFNNHAAQWLPPVALALVPSLILTGPATCATNWSEKLKCGPALGLRNKEDLSMLGCGLVLVVYVLAMKMNANTLPWVLNIQLTIALLMVVLGLIRLALDRRR